jgi:competence protein ComEC
VQNKIVKRINWNIVPAFKTLILVLVVLLPCIALKLSTLYSIIFACLSIAIGLLLIKRKRIRTSFFLLSFSIGFLLNAYISTTISIPKINDIKLGEAIISGEINSILKETDKYYRIVIYGYCGTKIYKNNKTRILLTVFKANNNSLNLEVGQKIYCETNIRSPQLPLPNSNFNEIQYFRTINCSYTGTTNISKLSIIGLPNNTHSILTNFKNNINGLIEKQFPEPSASIVKALILGDKSSLSPELKTSFSATGIAHLLAISGLHIGFISAIIMFVIGFIKNKYIKFILFSTGVILFVLISGSSPSAIRASLMAILYYFCYIIDRKSSPLNIASLVLLMYILFDPMIIFNISFQFSAISILSIIILYPIIYYKLYYSIGLYRYISASLAISIATSIALSPLIAYYFGIYSIISPITNLLIVPIFSLGLLYSILSILLFFIPLIGDLFANTATLSFDISLYINSFLSNQEISIISGNATVLVSIYISAILLVLFTAKKIYLFIFRTVYLSILFFMINKYSEFNNMNNFYIFERTQGIYLEYPNLYNKSICIILDYYPNKFPKKDYILNEYIKTKTDSLTIIYTGNFGISVVDELKATMHNKIKIIDYCGKNDELYSLLNNFNSNF